jgi:hypothetical protein
MRFSTTIFVEPGLDWTTGDMLGIMATSYDPHATDDKTILTYNNVTGQITFATPLNYYHFGR